MTPEEIKSLIQEQKDLNRLIESNTKSMTSFASAINDAGRLTKLVNRQMSEVATQSKKIQENTNKIAKTDAEILTLNANLTTTNKKKIATLNQERQILVDETDELNRQVTVHNEIINDYKKQITLLKYSLSSWKAIGNVISNEIGGALKNGWKSLMDQDKAVRTTQLSMGVLSNQSLSFSQNMYKTAIQTTALGVNAKELVKYQQDYSEQIGRTVILSQDGLTAMAEMAKGTMLGADGAAQMTSGMDGFGLSVTSARDIVQETVDSAHKMGVNSEATTKVLVNNLKTAQKYNFKGGVKGVADMTIQGQKFKISMEAVAGFADKLFTPEGAIDAAAQLQVLGGAWSQIADPFQLMYQARNDMEGLQKSMIEATAGAAQFNKETGEFKISGLELHRLRQAAEVTGQDFGSLAEQARELAKVKEINTKIDFSVPEIYKDFISSNSVFNKKTKVWEINMGGDAPVLVSSLTKANDKQLSNLILEKETLAERAKQSQTFDETWNNLKDMFKATLLPALDGFSTAMKTVLGDPAVVKGLTDFAVSIGKLAGVVGEFIAKNPWSAAITYGIFKTSQWVLNGIALGVGFNTVAGGTGKGSIISAIGNLFGKGGPSQFGSNVFQRSGSMYNKSTGAYMGDGIKSGIGQKGIGSMGTGLTTAGMLGIGGLVATGIGIGLEKWGEDRKTPGGQMARVGGKALTWGGTGLAIGSMFGPLGAAVGGGVGALAGAGAGMYEESQMQDYVMRPGQKAQPFSSNDTLIGFKPGGPIEKQSSLAGSSSPQSMQITFAPLKIEFGNITLQSGNSTSKIDLANDPILARELSSVIQQELRKAIGGGILNPNIISK